MNTKFNELAKLGAGEFEHIDGILIDHLYGTRDLLQSWSASEVLQNAGLYHAAYGTAGYDEKLVSLVQRDQISKIIGHKAEALVYEYCACDREFFWPRIGVEVDLVFKNRFTGKSYKLERNLLNDFCELTVANELEIAIDNKKFIQEYGSSLYKVFVNMRNHLSLQANNMVTAILGDCNA